MKALLQAASKLGKFCNEWGPKVFLAAKEAPKVVDFIRDETKQIKKIFKK